jgi:hypothetical protein
MKVLNDGVDGGASAFVNWLLVRSAPLVCYIEVFFYACCFVPAAMMVEVTSQLFCAVLAAISRGLLVFRYCHGWDTCQREIIPPFKRWGRCNPRNWRKL